MKIICLFILFVITNTSLYSQLRIGLNAGANFADAKISYPYSIRAEYPDGYIIEHSDINTRKSSAIINPGYGILISYNVWKYIWLQTELNYIKKGITLENNQIYSEQRLVNKTLYILRLFEPEAKYILDYYEIPIYAKAKFESEPVSYIFLLGISMGFPIKTQTEWKNYKGEDVTLKFDKTQNNTSFNLGMGMEIPASKFIDVMFDFTYSIGLANIENKYFSEFKLNGIIFRAGINVGIL